MKNILLVFLISFIGVTGRAQPARYPVIIDTKVHTGITLPFYKALSYLIQDDIYALDLSISFPTYGKNYWEKIYNYPRPGFGYSFWSLGNNEIFGKAHALYGYINMPLIKKTDRFSLNYQVSFGGSYLTKRFDKYENHLNRAISSHANVYIRIGIDSKIRLSSRSQLVFEAGGSHFSNGKTKSPNYGLNAGSFSLGFNYLIGNSNITIPDIDIPEPDKHYNQSVIYSAGIKVYDNLLDKKYFVSALTYNIERYIDHKRKIGVGGDIFYDGSISEALASPDGTPEKEFDKLIRLGLHGSYAISYKQLSMGIQVGHYLYSKYTVLTLIYSRISVQYMLSEHLSANIGIKSHWAKADNIEWGIGYSW